MYRSLVKLNKTQACWGLSRHYRVFIHFPPLAWRRVRHSHKYPPLNSFWNTGTIKCNVVYKIKITWLIIAAPVDLSGVTISQHRCVPSWFSTVLTTSNTIPAPCHLPAPAENHPTDIQIWCNAGPLNVWFGCNSVSVNCTVQGLIFKQVNIISFCLDKYFEQYEQVYKFRHPIKTVFHRLCIFKTLVPIYISPWFPTWLACQLAYCSTSLPGA